MKRRTPNGIHGPGNERLPARRCASRARIATSPDRTATPAVRRIALLSGVVALLLGAPGCDIFDSPTPPSTARVSVSSEGELPIRVITSNNFVTETDFDTGEATLNFFEADTIMVEGHHEGSYPMGPATRFVVNASVPESEEPQTVTLQVFLDDDERYNVTRALEEEEALQFIFRFN